MRSAPLLPVFFLSVFGPLAHGQRLTVLQTFPASGPNETVSAMTIDPSGLYMADGIGQSNLGNVTLSLDALVRKTDKAGKEQWVRRLGGAALIAGIAADAAGIYIAGHTAWNVDLQSYFALPGQPPLGFSDAFVRRYDRDGQELWTRQFGTENYDYVYGVAADATGVYVVGRLGAVYNLFPSGRSFLRKYDPDGNELWSRDLDVAYDLRSVTAAAGSVYVGGRYTPPGTDPAFLRRYDASGSELWTQLVTADYYTPAQVFGASAEGVYATEVLASGPVVAFYDLEGNKLREIPRGDSGRAIVADETGFFTAGGNYSLPGQCPAGAGDAEVRRYDPEGKQVWARLFGTWDSEVATAIAVDDTGVFAAGSMGRNAFVARVDKDTSTESDSGPQIRNQCVVNAASFEGGALAPGEIVTILGSGLGPAQAISANGNPGDLLPTNLGGTRVLVNGTAAPLLSVSDQQVNAVVPATAAAAGSEAVVQVEYEGVRSSPVNLTVFDSRFGMFRVSADSRETIVLNKDGTPNSPSTPAAPGSVVTLFATGAGPEDPQLPDGQIVASAPPHLRTSPRVYLSLYDESCDPVGEFEADALFAGGITGSVNGLVQIKVQLPSGMPGGDWNLTVKINGPFQPNDPYRGPSTVGGGLVSVR